MKDFKELNLKLAKAAICISLLILGLQLASLTWTLLPTPDFQNNIKTAQVGDLSKQNKDYSIDDIVKSLKLTNPWENSSAPKIETEIDSSKIEEKIVVPSTLDLVLIGTMILPKNKSWAILVRTKSAKEQLILQSGEEIDGAILDRIERNAVYFDRNGKLEKLIMQMLDTDGSANMPSGQPQRSARSKVGFSINPERMKSILQQGRNFFKGINITPYFSGSQSLGYRLKYGQENTVLTEFGINSGDVVEKINGVSVNNAAEISNLIQHLDNLSEFNIDVLRDGAPRTINIMVDK